MDCFAISTLSLIAAETNFGTFDGTAVIMDLNSSVKRVICWQARQAAAAG
jgi:hypothetical protein